MEEGFQKHYGRYPRVVITGPESTGKTELTDYLTLQFQGIKIPEFARQYVEQLQRPYRYKDVIRIARNQISIRNKIVKGNNSWIFMDTDLIITKVWFLEVYGRYPKWLDKHINTSVADLYLLCNNDVPWVEDGVRENGGDRRDHLFERYREQLEKQGFMYHIVSGTGSKRRENALLGIENYLKRYK